MSNSIYADLSSLSYLKGKQPTTYEGWVRDLNYSASNSTVWTQGNQVVLAIRGTDIKNKDDLGNDALIMTGLLQVSNRLAGLRKRFRQISSDPNKQVFLTGHSLAGRLVMELLKNNKILDRITEAHVYNPGTAQAHGISALTESILCKLKKRKRCKMLKQKLHIHHGAGDIISFLSRLEIGQHSTTGVGHSLSNFTQTETKPMIKPIETELHEMEPPSGPVEQEQILETEERVEPIEEDFTGGRIEFYTRRHQQGINNHYAQMDRLKKEHLEHLKKLV